MPKRRKLLNLPRKSAKSTPTKGEDSPKYEREVRTARGRLMGALLEVLEADESDDDRFLYHRIRKHHQQSDDEESDTDKTPPRQSYVLKLFDRSVDLSQFKDETPLYPICRAWIANQPKTNYWDFSDKNKEEDKEPSIELPGPEGSPISKIPPLLPEQKESGKDNINLEYSSPLPSREQLLTSNMQRWSRIRNAWLQQSSMAEARYDKTQKVLSSINVNNL